MPEFRQFIKGIQDQGNDGKAFEVFCRWFLENDPYWSTQVETVWLWNNWPDKWGPDRGIDLIFKHKNGETWAVQAKCYDEKYSVTKKDMDTFLSESSRTSIDHRLLMASTDDMSKNAIDTCVGQEKPVTLFLLKNFEEAKVEYPNNISELSTAKEIIKPSPDPHQERAIKDVISGFESSSRGQLIMACGTGKTFTTLWIKEALHANTTLVLVPSLNLLSQTLREWMFGANTDFEVLCVCSDTSVGRKVSEDISIVEAPFPVTSDVAEINTFLLKDEPKVIFCTYQSSDLIAETQKDGSIPSFDLVIADEAHRCAGKAEATFSRVLDKDQIRANKRLFTTATPRLYSDRVKSQASNMGVEIYGMDNEQAFGKVFHTLTFGQAIEENLLSDYQVIVVGVDEPLIKDWIDSQKLVSIDKEKSHDARTLASKIALLKTINDFDLKRVISFHSRVNDARDFASEVSELVHLIEEDKRPSGKLWSSYVSGEMRTNERVSQIRKLKELKDVEAGILANARCLSEGVDVPTLDGIAFINPKYSQVDIVQAVGRAIRKVRNQKEQTKGTIMIPVFLEKGETAERVIETSDFKPIWSVLRALRSHDQVLADELDQYRTDMARNKITKGQGIDDRIIFDLPESIDPGFVDALNTVLVEATTDSWEYWFGLLEDYFHEHGNTLVRKGYKVKDYNLSNWVVTQRKLKDVMSKDRFDKLTSVNFVWDVNKDFWERGYLLLKQYWEEKGDCLVPAGHRPKGFNLDSWVKNQRSFKDTLSDTQIERLNQINFTWDANEELWNRGYNCFRDYVIENNTVFIPARAKYKNYPLGGWVGTQRTQKKTLDKEKISKLNDLGFIWDVNQYKWEENTKAVEQFYSKYNHLEVPKGHIFNNVNLYNRFIMLRKSKNILSENQIERLNRVGFVWDTAAHHWETGIKLLKAFKEENGHVRVPQRYIFENFSLGNFVSYHRGAKNKISKEKIEALNALGFEWNPKDSAWEEGFEKLLEFKKKHGHCRVSLAHKKGQFPLRNWVQTQRSAQKDGTLSEERKSRLDQLGFIWDVIENEFDNAFKHLQAFYTQNGHIQVPNNYKMGDFNLNWWLRSLRTRKKNLNQNQIDRLDAMGFDWDPLMTIWTQSYNKYRDYVLGLSNNKSLSGSLRTWTTNQRKYKGRLSQDQIEKLNDLNFDWSVKTRDDMWLEAYNALKSYYEENGNCRVPPKHKQQDINLGSWVANQRTYREEMDDERLNLLNQIDFIWDPIKDDWDRAFVALQDYFAEHGNSLVHNKLIVGKLKLGAWVAYQRRNKEKLSKEQLEKLNSVKFPWNSNEAYWNLSYTKLKSYKEENGDCIVPHNYKIDGLALGTWVSEQRKNKDGMLKERKEKLNALGFSWNPLEEAWQKGLGYLRSYYMQYGDSIVPQTYKTDDGFALGAWVKNLRKRAKNKLIEDNRVSELEKLNFVWEVEVKK